MVGRHLFSPLQPQLPHFHLFRAPADRVWVGEQLCSEDVPVPVCKFEQLHILHRFLSWKVGSASVKLQFLFTVNSMSDCAEMFCFKLPCPNICQESLPFPPHCIVIFWPRFSIYKTLPCLEMWQSCGLSDIISNLKCLFFSVVLSFLWLNFAANVAHLNLFRFAGRPGKYNKLFNRWRLEEVSAISNHHKWVIILFQQLLGRLLPSFCVRVFLELSNCSSF